MSADPIPPRPGADAAPPFPTDARPTAASSADGRSTPRVALVAAVLVGALAGLSAFTLQYAEGLSYLSNDPAACANCHIMNEQLDGWRKGVHHAAATCNDCHVPQPFLAKYLAKAQNGYHHSSAFTFQPRVPDAPGARLAFEEPIRIKPGNARVLQENCLRCHGDLVHEIVNGSSYGEEATRCVQCHRGVGHAGAR